MGGGSIGNADLIDDESVANVVCAFLVEDETLQIFGAEGVDGCGLNVGERDADFDPSRGGYVAGVFSQVEWSAETGREFGNLEALAGSREDEQRHVCGGDGLWGVDGEVEIVAVEAGAPVAVVEHGDLRVPSSSGRGLPLNANRIGGRAEGGGVDRKAAFLLLDEA